MRRAPSNWPSWTATRRFVAFALALCGPLWLAASLRAQQTAPAAGAAAPPESREDSLARATSLRQAGEWEGALSLLRSLWVSDPRPPDKAAALAYGRMCLLKDDPDAAEGPLREVADAPGPLAPYGHLLLAECLFKKNLPAEAAVEARRADAPGAPKGLSLRALRLLADAEGMAGHPARAVLALRELLAAGPSRGQAEEARFALAQALEASGKGQEAGRLYLAAYRNPRSTYGRRAAFGLGRLAASGRFKVPSLPAPRALDFARNLLAAGRREDAWEVLKALPDSALTGAQAQEAGYLRTATLFALRYNAACAQEADRLADTYGTTRPVLGALLKAAWATLRTGDHAAVVARCRKILDAAKKDEGLQAEALHCMGTSAYTHGLWQEASDDLERVENLPASRVTQASALYKRAWCLERLGDLAGSRALFHACAQRFPGQGYEGACRYWAARDDLALGNREAAIGGLVALAEEAPHYWGWRARVRLASMGLAIPETPRPNQVLPWGPSCRTPQTELAYQLDLAGLDADAADAFLPFYGRNRKDPSAVLTLALLDARAGRYAAGASLVEHAFGPVDRAYDAPPLLLSPAYPAPDLGLVLPAAAREEVDPALVLAVIRQESFFDAHAFSPAGAQGLMQLMPDTAERLGDGPGSMPDLMDSEVNLRLGVKYLGELTRRFPPPAAVAAYNAGEDAVGRWASAFGTSDEDTFVAMIPYAETRAYAAQVLWNFHVYQRIMSGGAHPAAPEH